MSTSRVSRKTFGWPQVFIGLLATAVGLLGAYDWSIATPVAQDPPKQPQIIIPSGQNQYPSPATGINCAQVPCLALTFDDGPNPAITPQILDILERHHAHVTFFLIGVHVPGNEGMVRRMHDNGHEIGNHSWNHADFTTLNGAQIEQQIAQTQAAITAAGVPAPTLFRPPYGAVNALVRSHVPLTFALWNDDPEDWKAKDAQKVMQEVLATAKSGRVVVMHDVHQQTADALDPLLTDLQQHYQLVTMSQLFNLNPGQRGSFYGR